MQNSKLFTPLKSPPLVSKSLQLPLWSQKKELLEAVTLCNRILLAQPIPDREAIEPGRYQLIVNIKIPGQWRRDEIDRVLDLTAEWGWGGVLDAKTLAQLERLLDAVAAGRKA